MKIYVDGELPKNCTNCPFYKLDTCTNTDHTIINNYRCILYGSILTGNCQLETLQSLKQQVREEVVEETIKAIDDKFNCLGYVEEKFEDVKKYILDQVKGENND